MLNFILALPDDSAEPVEFSDKVEDLQLQVNTSHIQSLPQTVYTRLLYVDSETETDDSILS